MPLNTEVKSNLIKTIQSKQGTEKLRLIALYKQLMDMYDEDHKYNTVINHASFNSHEKIRDLANRGFQIMRNQLSVKDEDLIDKDEFFTKEEQESENFKKEAENKEVPKFWSNLLLSIPRLAFMITEKDEEVLAYLDHIEIFRNQDNSDCRVELTFKENEFFTNTKLVIESKSNEDAEEEIEKIICEGINWKAGKNYLVSTTQKKVGNKKGKKKTVDKETRNESFFWIFKNFNGSDFEIDEEDDLADYDMEPTSDRCLFDMACDFIETMANDFLVYVIPNSYGVSVPNFNDQCGGEDCGDDCGETCGKDQKGSNPQNCKQQ